MAPPGTVPLSAFRQPRPAPPPPDAPYRPTPLTWRSPVDWGDRTPPRHNWIVEGCFLAGTVAMLSGDGGLGKSLIMQQLCTCAAAGRMWLGHSIRRVRSLALFCEDDADELERRQYQINRHYGCANTDLDEFRWLSRPGQDSALMTFGRWGSEGGKVTDLGRALERKAKDFGAQIIVCDTRKDVFRGNQIDEDQARVFVSHLRRLAIAIEGVVILTAHPSQTGRSEGSGESGSVAWHNSVRSRLYLYEDKAKLLWLRTMKNNHAARGGKIPLAWRQGVFVRTDEQQKLDEECPF